MSLWSSLSNGILLLLIGLLLCSKNSHGREISDYERKKLNATASVVLQGSYEGFNPPQGNFEKRNNATWSEGSQGTDRGRWVSDQQNASNSVTPEHLSNSTWWTVKEGDKHHSNKTKRLDRGSNDKTGAVGKDHHRKQKLQDDEDEIKVSHSGDSNTADNRKNKDTKSQHTQRKEKKTMTADEEILSKLEQLRKILNSSVEEKGVAVEQTTTRPEVTTVPKHRALAHGSESVNRSASQKSPDKIDSDVMTERREKIYAHDLSDERKYTSKQKYNLKKKLLTQKLRAYGKELPAADVMTERNEKTNAHDLSDEGKYTSKQNYNLKKKLLIQKLRAYGKKPPAAKYSRKAQTENDATGKIKEVQGNLLGSDLERLGHSRNVGLKNTYDHSRKDHASATPIETQDSEVREHQDVEHPKEDRYLFQRKPGLNSAQAEIARKYKGRKHMGLDIPAEAIVDSKLQSDGKNRNEADLEKNNRNILSQKTNLYNTDTHKRNSHRRRNWKDPMHTDPRLPVQELASDEDTVEELEESGEEKASDEDTVEELEESGEEKAPKIVRKGGGEKHEVKGGDYGQTGSDTVKSTCEHPHKLDVNADVYSVFHGNKWVYLGRLRDQDEHGYTVKRLSESKKNENTNRALWVHFDQEVNIAGVLILKPVEDSDLFGNGVTVTKFNVKWKLEGGPWNTIWSEGKDMEEKVFSTLGELRDGVFYVEMPVTFTAKDILLYPQDWRVKPTFRVAFQGCLPLTQDTWKDHETD